MSCVSGNSWRVYRVIGITDENDRGSLNHIYNPGFGISLSASSYCTPGIAFWLTDSGIEVPDSECILLEYQHVHFGTLALDPAIVEFEWDGGRYVGSSEIRDDRPTLRWADGQICDATIFGISSL